MQVKYPSGANLPVWVKEGPEIVVKVFKYDRLRESITVTNQIPTNRDIPSLRSFEENEFDLHLMYGMVQGSNTSNLIVGNKTGDLGLIGNRSARDQPDRNRCVLCVDIRSHPGFHIANVKEDCPSMPAVTTGPASDWRGPSCKRCYWLRRPCVWVPDTDLLSNERFKFIRIPHAYSWGAQDIQASHTQEMQEMGPTEEEIEDDQGDDIDDDTDDDDA
jgi:hypothetical protein